MRESPHALHALIASVTSVNVPPPCSILYEDWEPYWAEDPDLKVLLDWGIKKNIELQSTGGMNHNGDTPISGRMVGHWFLLPSWAR